MSHRSRGRFVLADAGFWIGFCDTRDSKHEQSVAILDSMSRCQWVVPWPILYEVVGTRFVKRPSIVERLNRALDADTAVSRVDDRPYRERALSVTLSWAVAKKRTVSLVDMVLRLMIEDQIPPLHALVTFNPGDFTDSCRRARIPLICDAGGASSFTLF